MFLLALMMSSCPDKEPSISSKDIVRSRISKEALNDLKEKMKDRGIPFNKVVMQDEKGSNFIEIEYYTMDSFRIFKDPDGIEYFPIAHYEISKYFAPLLGVEGGIDYLITFDHYHQQYVRLDNLTNYSTDIDDKSRFFSNLYYYQEGDRYIDTLLKRAISSITQEINSNSGSFNYSNISPIDELKEYMEELQKTIFSLSRKRADFDEDDVSYKEFMELNKETFTDEYFTKDNIRIIKNIIEDHKSFFEELLGSFKLNVKMLEGYRSSNEKNVETENHNEILSIASKLLSLIEAPVTRLENSDSNNSGLQSDNLDNDNTDSKDQQSLASEPNSSDNEITESTDQQVLGPVAINSGNAPLTSNLDYLKRDMIERGISFDEIVKEDEESKKFVEVKSGFLNSFKLGDFPIAHYELSKYFVPLLLEKEIDYLVYISPFDERKEINEFMDYEIGARGENRFLRNLKGNEYINSLLKEAEKNPMYDPYSLGISPVEEFRRYMESLVNFIEQLSLRKEEFADSDFKLNNHIFNNNEFFDEKSRRIIRRIVTDHKDVFESLFRTFKERIDRIRSEHGPNSVIMQDNILKNARILLSFIGE